MHRQVISKTDFSWYPFFLTAQLCYYDSSKDGKCHGTIMIRDIEKVEEAEPQHVPTLKENEAGFFFAVSHQMLRKR